MLDEHGMPVPHKSSPLPWKQFDAHEMVDANRDEVVCAVRRGFATNADCKFSVHAANWIIPCREIVRKLGEWNKEYPSLEDVAQLMDDAAKLWANMQRDAKGGDGE